MQQHWTVETSETRGTVDLHLEASDLQPQLRNDPFYSIASGQRARFQKEALSICAVGQWIILMDAQLLSTPVHPPSAAVFQGRQGEQIAQKAVDGKNCSHTTKSLLSLYRGRKRGEVLGWPVGPVTGGQFVKQRDFGRAHCSAGGWRGGKTNHDLQSHSGKLFNYFRLIVIASLGPVFKNENRNVHMAWNYSIQAPFCVMLFQRGACSSQASNERAKVMMKWVVNTWIPDRQAFVEIKLIFGQC